MFYVDARGSLGRDVALVGRSLASGVAAQPVRVSALGVLATARLLLLTLALQVLEGTEGEGAADQDDGVQTDASRGAVGCRGGGAGLSVLLGLGVALLGECQLMLDGCVSRM